MKKKFTRSAIALFIFLLQFFCVSAQNELQYYRPSNTGIGGDYNQVINIAVTITNTLGEVIYRNTLHDNQTSCQISLSKKVIDGIYTVTVTSNEKIIHQQLIIQH